MSSPRKTRPQSNTSDSERRADQIGRLIAEWRAWGIDFLTGGRDQALEAEGTAHLLEPVAERRYGSVKDDGRVWHSRRTEAGRMGEMEKAAGDEAAPLPSGRFVKVARVRDIPVGGTHRVEVRARLMCLVNVNGQIYAVSDDCPHIGGALSDGELTGCVLTCPVHLAQFDVRSGRVLRGPAREDVPAYAVRVVGDDVCVSVPDDQKR